MWQFDYGNTGQVGVRLGVLSLVPVFVLNVEWATPRAR